LKDFEITSTTGVLLYLLRTKLQIQMNTGRDALSLIERVLQDFGIHVHVGHLPAGATAAVCGVDAHFLFQ